MFPCPRFSDVDDVLRRANNTEYGLASGVFTQDISKALYVSEKLNAGTVFINTYNKTDVASPFGGFKQSGFGKDLGNTNDADVVLLFVYSNSVKSAVKLIEIDILWPGRSHALHCCVCTVCKLEHRKAPEIFGAAQTHDSSVYVILGFYMVQESM